MAVLRLGSGANRLGTRARGTSCIDEVQLQEESADTHRQRPRFQMLPNGTEPVDYQEAIFYRPLPSCRVVSVPAPQVAALLLLVPKPLYNN